MKYSQSIVAKQYAKAYLNEFGSMLTLSDINQIKIVINFCKTHYNFMSLVSILPIERTQKHHTLMDEMIEHFKLPSSLLSLIDIMVRHKRLSLFASVLQDICCLFGQKNNILDVTIYSAVELDDEQKKKFEEFFTKHSGKTIVSNIIVDHNLIAGVRLQSNIFLWEYSIAGRIRQFSQNLKLKK